MRIGETCCQMTSTPDKVGADAATQQHLSGDEWAAVFGP